MESLIGDQFVLSDGSMVDLNFVRQAKVVLLHFGAAWCPPCRGFKATFHKFYADVNKGDGQKNVEVVTVPCEAEDEQEAYQEHLQEAHWPFIPLGDPRVEKLQNMFEVDAIPLVLLVKKDGTIGCDTVKALIQAKGAGCLPELIKMGGGEQAEAAVTEQRDGTREKGNCKNARVEKGYYKNAR